MLNTKESHLQHDKMQKLFILPLGEDKAYISYYLQDDVMYLAHSEVPAKLRGQGIGKKLVEETFAYIEKHQIKAVARCSYIKGVRDRNARWRQLID